MFLIQFLFIVIISINIESLSAEIHTKDLTSDEFQLDCLLIHNKIREKHCSQKIQFSSKLKTLATRRATNLAENDGKGYSRIPDSTFGENVYRHKYRVNSTQTDCKAIVLKWYKEKKNYNWKAVNFVSSSTRRFAQIVWNSTIRIGCASVASVGPNAHVFVVCNYYNSVKFPINSSENVLSIEKCDQKLSEKRFRVKPLTTGEWLQNCISEHNRIRKIHSVEPLTINAEVFQASQKRATEMAERGFRFFRHKPSKYGENIHWSKQKQLNGSLNCNVSISKWYSEKKSYDWDYRQKHNATVRHFIQMVWKSTQLIGCSQVKNIEEEKGGIYTVCMYDPIADYGDSDQQWENVFPSPDMVKTESPLIVVSPGAHDYERVDELDEETELEKEFKDVDDIIDTRKVFDRQTPAPSLEDMFIKTTTESIGFDRSEYMNKSKGLRRKN